MKKLLSVFLVVVMIVTALPLTTFNLSASAEVYGYYEYEVDNGEATITYVDESISGDITIPSTLGGYPVTSIGGEAFYCCSSLTSVAIPDSVTSIGYRAFSYCSSLTEINVGSGNQSYSSKDGVLFNKSKTELICCPGGKSGEYVIPNSVTSIGYRAFSYCSSLNSVTIPDNVTGIGDWAFYYCGSLTAINVDSSNQNFSSEDGLLFNKDKTELIRCPEGKSGEYVIPDSVTSIGDCAFEYCDSLTSVAIPDSVLNIGEDAFYDCSSLNEINVGSGNQNFFSEEGILFNKDKTELICCPGGKSGEYVIPNSVTSIGSNAFYDCSSLTSVTIPDSVLNIGSRAFYGTAYYNNSNNWENNVLYIGNYLIRAKSNISGAYEIKSGTKVIADLAFYECDSLTSVTIPDSVTSIGVWAFSVCSSLTSVTIPDSVTSIGEGAFYDCSSLTSVTIPNSVTSIGNSAFEYCDGLTSVTIPDSVTSIGSYTFYECDSLTSVKIGDSVTSIGDYAFYACSSLTTVTIGSRVKSIGIGAFEGCDSLTSVTIPDSVLNIGNCAFESCSSLTSVTIPDSVTSIGYWAFCRCSSLTFITIPNSVTSIGAGAFYDTAYYNNSNNWKNNVLYIGNYLIEAKDDIFGAYEIKSGTKVIADDAFEYCDSLTSVTIPNSVTSIGDGAFEGCSSLTAVTIPDSVTSIGDWAFCRCSSLTSVTIGDSVTSIGEGAFCGCSSLTSVTIGDSVTSIGDYAFSECYNLTIYGYRGSVAEDYALENEIKFSSITDEDCSHKNTTVHPAKASTCIVQGNNKYTTCNDCGKVISGSNAKLPLAGHKYTTKITKATLTKNGSVVKKCSVCGKVASTTVIYYPKTVKIAATTYTYNGKVITPAVTVKNSKGTALKKGTDYTVTYASGRKNVGKYKVTITFKGNYSGTKTFYFTINPVKTTVSKLTAGKKSIKVNITKKSTQVKGYQIQYSTSKTFKSAKTKTVSSYKTTSTTLTKLTAKKTYYVRVRTYKTVGKTNYYSGWSTYKYTKTK